MTHLCTFMSEMPKSYRFSRISYPGVLILMTDLGLHGMMDIAADPAVSPASRDSARNISCTNSDHY